MPENTFLIAALWLALAFVASLVSIRAGVSVALIEIGMGIVGGNALGLSTTPWTDFLAGFGAVLLTFLAGAEIDPESLRRNLRPSLAIGVVSFLAPFLAAFGFVMVVVGWPLPAAEVAGIALSTTSVAVVYAVMVETGLSRLQFGKLILAACFVTDLGTVLALGLLFARPSGLLLLFIVASVVTLPALPRLTAALVRAVPGRVSEPEIKFLLVVLLSLGGLATIAGSEAVLPAYVAGLAVAGVFAADKVLVHRMRATAFSLLTPFYFLKAGLFVSLPSVLSGIGLIAALFAVKVGAKSVAVWPVARLFGLIPREASYTTLMMSTGLTFGSISALFGLQHGLIDQIQYTILVSVVIASAVIPTLVAQRFFHPHHLTGSERDEVEAAGEIDAVPEFVRVRSDD
jgi:Kef-type K+ transport system membrane component KefB